MTGDAVVMLVAFVLGLGAILRGVSMVSPPIAWIVLGCAFLLVAAWPLVRARWIR